MLVGSVHLGSIETGVARTFFQLTIVNGGWLDIKAVAPTATVLELQIWRLVHSSINDLGSLPKLKVTTHAGTRRRRVGGKLLSFLYVHTAYCSLILGKI